LGMVHLDASLADAEHTAGVPMAYDYGEHCTTLSPVDRPAGVAFVSTSPGTAGRVDVIIVNAPGIRTTEGVGVGDTVAEVVSAYPGIEQRLTDGRGRLVHRPADPALARYEMFFEVVDGEVAAMWSGPADIASTDELCA
jgi:hypothetical protein